MADASLRISDVVKADAVEVSPYDCVSRADGWNRGRFLGEGSVAVSEKEDYILLCSIGKDYVQEAVVIEIARCNAGYIASRIKNRSLKGAIAIPKDDDETSIADKASARGVNPAIGAAKRNICVAVAIE